VTPSPADVLDKALADLAVLGTDQDREQLTALRDRLAQAATRSPRAGAPALRCPQPVPTARSEMNVSSVSPDRCETNCRYPACRQMDMASRVSVTVPIWLSLISDALPIPQAMAWVMMAGLVQKMSSPTSP
jgi:hypothetical protein